MSARTNAQPWLGIRGLHGLMTSIESENSYQ